MTGLLLVVAVVVVAYWVLWFCDRSAVASSTRPAYYQFEDAFPLADGWLALTLVGAAWSLWRRRGGALAWLLCGAGAGLYLLGMDVLYDLEHGIWSRGTGGAIELCINIATAVLSLSILRWAWRRRDALMEERAAPGR
jgi:hypothetical protein